MYSIKTLYKIGNGPSSSHTMGPKKACEYILNKYPEADYFEITLFESLALTGKGHLTDYVIEETFKNKEHIIKFDIKTITSHPNTMRFKVFLKKSLLADEEIQSIGGGLIKVIGEKEVTEKEIYPHDNFDEIKKYCLEKNISLVDYVNKFEDDKINQFLESIYHTMMDMIDRGLSKEGYLPGDLKVLRKAKEIYQNRIPEESTTRKEKRLISAYAFASSEENASGGIVVTSPTCGSCGVIPALVRYYEEQGYGHDEIIDALKVAGLIGLLVKQNASIAGAECGCQAEIGTASSMGAAFVSQIKKEGIIKIERAAEIAMEHCLGLTCDPIKGYVQIPCIERNAIGALRSIEAASLTDFIDSTSSKISFDMVIKTMYETGKDMNKSYRETSKGGLAKQYK